MHCFASANSQERRVANVTTRMPRYSCISALLIDGAVAILAVRVFTMSYGSRASAPAANASLG